MHPLSKLLFLAFFTLLFPADLKAQFDDSSTPVASHGALSVSGTKIVDQDGRIVSFAGNSFSWSNTYWGAEEFFNADVVSWLQEDWGSTILRVALGVDEVSGYFDFPEDNLNRVETVVDAAIANGMYVIIDWHSYRADEYQPQAIEFFQQMARKYGDKPNVIYEIYNEPVHVSWPNTVKPYAEAVISAIREIDPDNMIIVGTPTWSQDVDIVSLDPIEGYDNIAYTLHFYAATHGESLRQKAQIAIDNGLPLFVTEWGTVEASADGPINHLETDLWISFLEENHISHCNWSITGKDESSAVVLPGANPFGGWSEDDLSPSGRKAKDIIGSWPRYANADVSTGAYPDGVPHTIPGVINPTHYDNGGFGEAYVDASVGNFGNGTRQDDDVDTGDNGVIGWIEEGEWVEFSVDVETAGLYVVSYEVASLHNGAFHLEFDGENKTDTVNVETTGGWGAVELIDTIVNLEAGEQKMRIVMGEGTFNLGEINFYFLVEDLVPPTITIDSIGATPQPAAAGRRFIKIDCTSSDNVSVDRNRLLVFDIDTELYWNGSSWIEERVSFDPESENNNDWSYTLDLPVGGRYKVAAWAWDFSNNVTRTKTHLFAETSDEVPPSITIDSIGATPQPAAAGRRFIKIDCTSSDNVSVDRNRLLVFDIDTELYWNGSSWIDKRVSFDPESENNNDWSYTLDLPVGGRYKVAAWAWDSSDNMTRTKTHLFAETSDEVPPNITIDSIGATPQSAAAGRRFIKIDCTSSDNVSVDRNRLLVFDIDTELCWNGSSWIEERVSFDPELENNNDWSYTLDLPVGGRYKVAAWAWDSSNNVTRTKTHFFAVAP